MFSLVHVAVEVMITVSIVGILMSARIVAMGSSFEAAVDIDGPLVLWAFITDLLPFLLSNIHLYSMKRGTAMHMH